MNNTMHTADLIRQYLELKQAEKDLKTRLEAVTLAIEGAMVEAGTFELVTAAGTAKLGEVNARRFDSKSFKADHPDLAMAYTVTRSETRFTVKGVK